MSVFVATAANSNTLIVSSPCCCLLTSNSAPLTVKRSCHLTESSLLWLGLVWRWRASFSRHLSVSKWPRSGKLRASVKLCCGLRRLAQMVSTLGYLWLRICVCSTFASWVVVFRGWDWDTRTWDTTTAQHWIGVGFDSNIAFGWTWLTF